MSNYKLKYLILNNFRNIEYNSSINKEDDIKSIKENNHKGFYEFGREDLTIFDGENGYGKTTFFYALEFLFLGKELDLELKAKENSIVRERNGDSLRNNKDKDRNEYFVRGIFEDKNGNLINIIRYVENEKEIEFCLLKELKDGNLQEVNFTELFGIDFENHYKNFIYLPQDNVFEFLLDGGRGDSVTKILNLENETNLLNKLNVSGKGKENKCVLGKIEETITKLENKKTEITNKNQDIIGIITNIQKKESEQVDISKFTNISFFNKNYTFQEIQEKESIDYKYLIIDKYSKDFDSVKYILENKEYYKYKFYFDKINKLKASEILFDLGDFKDFIYCLENYADKDFKYKDISSSLANFNLTISNLEDLKIKLENLELIQSLESIEKLKENDFSKYKNIVDLKLFLDFIKNIQKEIKEKNSDNQKYDWLKTNIQYIYNNISNKESYKNIEVLNIEGNLKKESICPTCGTDFLEYDKLLESVKKQLDYFSDKSKNTKDINEKIQLFYKSTDFLSIKTKISELIIHGKKEQEELEKISGVLKLYEKFYGNKEIKDFINKNRNNFENNNYIELFNLFSKSLNNKLPIIDIIDIDLIGIQNEIENKYYSILNKDDYFNLIDSNFLFSIENISENKNLLIKYKENLKDENELKKNLELIENNKKLIQYYTKRVGILNNIKEKFTILNKTLYETVKEYENKLIANIKLPFYIFSKRILKNYEGDGLLLSREDGKTKIDITSLNYQKNPVFNFSQGQLTATMISILLALNISLSNNGKIDFLLIDDPIQTLDDLNQLAFINLLRYQFADKQIILSTHEQEFSNFIRYKFWRLGLSQKSFNVKDRFLS